MNCLKHGEAASNVINLELKPVVIVFPRGVDAEVGSLLIAAVKHFSHKYAPHEPCG